jgi:hypothetical protein
MRLDHTIEGFWLARRHRLSQYSGRDYDMCFRRLSEFPGNPNFEKIKAADLNRFLNSLAKKDLSQKTMWGKFIHCKRPTAICDGAMILV